MEWNCWHKHHTEQANNQLNLHLKKPIGINPCLMLPGNYARILFSQKNEGKILYFCKYEEEKQNYANLLIHLRFMNNIFISSKPKHKFPDE